MTLIHSTLKIRTAVIGAGFALDLHLPGLKLDTSQVVGIAEVREEVGRKRAELLETTYFHEPRAMIAQTRPDLVVILTPHPSHAGLAIEAMEAGCHVLVEKPMAVHAGEADAMIAAAQKFKRILAVNLQHRLRPEVIAARRIIQNGRLGMLQHMHYFTAWPRTRAYYRSSPWRATWKYEGGGVLLNQAPHDLDLICHLLGLPDGVTAFVRTQLHEIEVEDTADAILDWPGGLVGFFHTSTAEGGSEESLEIKGTNGVMRIRSGRLEFEGYEMDLRDYLKNSSEHYCGPVLRPVDVPLPDSSGNHAAVYQNIHATILKGEPLSADGVSGRMSLELANAMILSNARRERVVLPIDRSAYRDLLTNYQNQ